ncbi:C25 family cysteine peptidase [Dyadobacter sp. SG02]|uniref:putative type IX secretion system sortase PorU2 n=1 Tax=Dyadobacter sp. SG02 TaxID=1855291 RepID=UPI0015A551EA|nr:C25 family cysteine peptidase [Dyadobacter sp. SG02]
MSQKGIHRIPFGSLPADFSVKEPDKIQLWHRGKQVSIISTANSEVLFYAVPNDGATDSLFYRPMSSRKNPYFSMYSDKSAYFLVNGDVAGSRAKIQTSKSEIQPLASVVGTNLNVYQQEYSMSTESPIRPGFYNSFFEFSASKTGKTTLGNKLTLFPFTLTGRVPKSGAKTTVKLLFHGRSNNVRKLEVYVGKTEQTLRLTGSPANAGFDATEYSFDIGEDDVDSDGKATLGLKSVATDPLDRFSLDYFAINYPRDLNMAGVKSFNFTIPATAGAQARLSLKNAPADAKILDISNVDVPVVVQSALTDFTLTRESGRSSNLLVSNEVVTVAAANILSLKFKKYDLSPANYVIVTSENLLEGAQTYANYRASAAGGSYKPVVVNIKDIYDQFNYGEPSPVGIRRFTDYLLSQGSKDKYMLLIGKSITHNERMKRELPDEVPTVGYPGSDVLLVEGLGGAASNVPSLPLGRIPAVTNATINDYLQKVKEYESNSFGDVAWRKKVLHLNGGKTASEISQLRDMLKDLVPYVTDGIIGGKVTPFSKQQGIGEVEKVNITPEVNAGVGLITYFGHGSVTVTDLDMGYATDEVRAYANNLRYPMMYFNGCGVGNIFSGRFNPAPNTNDRYSLSMDWLLAAKRGSIAIIANSFESFVSPSEKYLERLYNSMFVAPATFGQTIGKIQIAVAKDILAEDKGTYAVANIHQSILQGDPALRLVTVENPDYAVDPQESISIYSESANKTIGNSANLQLKVAMTNHGRYKKGELVPVQINYVGRDGTVTKTESVPSFAFSDTLEVKFETNKSIRSIQVVIDPQSTLIEISRKNNIAELPIDWDVAEGLTVYPSTAIKDIVPPVIHVTFNERNLENNEVIAPNPRIRVYLEDDRLVLRDTSLIEVLLRPCQDESCKFVKVSYKLTNVSLDSINTHSIQFNYLSANLPAGKYELLVNGKDVAGNTYSEPYHIFFEIQEVGSESIEVTSSPNPTSSYLRMEAKLGTFGNSGGKARNLIYDARGNVVFESKVTIPRTERFEWYLPVSNLTPGIYIYKVFIEGQSSTAEFEKTGRVVIVR